MDVSSILAGQAQKLNEVTVEKGIDLAVDAGYLTVTDPNPIDESEFNRDLEEHLKNTARDGIQHLINTLLQLPTTSTPDGPLTKLPPPTTLLPRQKPLPKPKAPTKWEKFAAAKGIQKKRREKKEWDEERQEWRDRWGRDGKNKEGEGQWLTEVKANAEIDADPEKELREARKSRVAKNERQRLQNQARAAAESERAQRKTELERTLASTRISTASMGKFDRKLEGEKKIKGVKRKFEPTERSVADEQKASLAILSKIDGSGRKARKEKEGDDVLNVRKAVRFASKGNGSASLARGQGSSAKRGGRGRR
ncbi:RRS1-domain-containing [Pyrrhoderma noxium]|uniref:Ribosome biogenesis regulatory protein n=1 Tax=Pyrrhoderma noxium TaxID=2282107 RepID=A0A286UNN9_9AGAM|nr:RRS1-domain-containing [Pyrrhoderma noxium]